MCKKIRGKFFVAPLVGLVTTLLSAGNSAQALTPVTTCGQTLSVSGEYLLTRNLVCPDTGVDFNGVTITASNVVFHLAGRSISSTVCDLTRNISGIFVTGGLSGVRVDGGTVRGFNDGIVLSSSNSRVVGMTVTKACAFGILGGGENNWIEENVVTASGDGVALSPAKLTHVTANHLSGNVRAGVALSDFADANFIEQNILNNNGDYGIAVFNGNNTIIRNNAANRNRIGIALLSTATRDGATILPHRVLDNTAHGNSATGIWITGDGAPGIVRRNSVFGSGSTDMQDDTLGCVGNTWSGNTFRIDVVAGVSNGGPAVPCLR
ncbi:MAG: right-handed parallel beta-helix repeat-containing protein [Deltaproteobacteria bacterium]|nr:right-handed parallel beta-helix repeat-containing protein [Deltaproteobacteria bacterium]